jgi:uncharacterized membrane protein
VTDLATRTARSPAAAGGPGSSGVPIAVRALPWVLLVGGIVGLVAAAVLLVEKIALLEDPSYVPSCSINPILSCGSIMRTDQAEVFGFPNPILGVAAFPVVATIGAAAAGRVKLPGWFWVGLQAGAVFGVGFVHWLIFQSLYRIDALCPYCMVVWAVTIPVFWYTTLANVHRWTTPAGPRHRLVDGLLDYHGVGLTIWYLAITAAVGHRFWDYWSTLLP